MEALFLKVLSLSLGATYVAAAVIAVLFFAGYLRKRG